MRFKVLFFTFLFYILGYLLVLLVTTNHQEVYQLNNNTAHQLEQLVTTKYFRIIRLNLNRECPLKEINKMCKAKSCSVCRCDEKDIPSTWMKTDKVQSQGNAVDYWSK